MCGIFGGYRTDGKQWVNFEAAKKALHHRGPDQEGVFNRDHILLGNTRLAVQDPEAGKQPFFSDDEKIVVVQNGEIYNHVELRESLTKLGIHHKTRCDTEVILRLYEHRGLDFLSDLNGMFGIAIYDGRKDELYLIRDRLGVKPLFYTWRNGQFAFASEIKAILELVEFPRKINHQALSNYFSFNYIPPPETIFRDVWHVMPGCVVTFSKAGIKESRWWSIQNKPSEFRTYNKSWAEELMARLTEATDIRLRSDVPIGSFLSGGLDSSTVLALMNRRAQHEFPAFSIGFDDPRFDETDYANLAAKRFGASLVSKIVHQDLLDKWPEAIYYSDQPHGDVSFLPTWEVAKLASMDVKVVLTGDGGDELFAGYEKYLNFFRRNSSRTTWSVDDFTNHYWPTLTLFGDAEKHRLLEGTPFEKKDLRPSSDLVREILHQYSEMDPINWALVIDTLLLLPGNNLVKPDRMAMAASVETRSPFLDVNVVEFAFATHGSLKLANGETKQCLKMAVAPLIGIDLAYRKKQMFTVPVGEWFKNERADYCRTHISSLVARGVVNNRFCNDLLAEHLDSKKNRTRELRALIALDHWCTQFKVEA